MKKYAQNALAFLLVALLVVSGTQTVQASDIDELPVIHGIQENLEEVDELEEETVQEEEVAEEVAEKVTIEAEVGDTPAVGQKELVILHTNDMHGNVEKKEGKKFGYAAYKNLIDAYKKEGKNVFVIDAGDATQGTNIASLSEGEDIINLMNEAGVQAFTPGNHEFDYSQEQAFKNMENSKFPWYASNVFDELTRKPVFKTGEIVEAGDIRLGIFGLATPETKYKADPRNTAGLRFANTVEENVEIAQKEIDKLRAEGAQVVVLISHLGSDESSEVRTTNVVPQLKGLDLFIDGHSHTRWEEGMKVGEALGASTGATLDTIGEVTIKVNLDGSVETSARLIEREEVETYGEDEAIASQIATILEEQEKTQGVPVGNTKIELDGVRENVRTRETNMANLITDAMLKESEADLVITNGGGIRASIEAGEITVGEVFTVLPFGNAMTVIKVTGQEIVDALNYGVSDYPNPAGKFPQVAGVSYKIIEGNPEKEEKSTVTQVMIHGQEIDLEKTYELATNDFMAVGGDGYEMFAGKEQVRLYGSLAKVVEGYIAELTKEAGAFEYATDGRIALYDGTEVEVPEEHPEEKPSDKPAEKPEDKPAEKPADKPKDKPAEKQTEKPAEKTTKKSNPETGDTPVYFVALGLAAAAYVVLKKKEKAA